MVFKIDYNNIFVGQVIFLLTELDSLGLTLSTNYKLNIYHYVAIYN